jgi:hypothetical protein
MTTTSNSVANFDVAGLADRFLLFANEIINCQSAVQVEFNVHDQKRGLSYMAELTRWLDIISLPNDPMDLPKSHPGSYPVLDFVTDDNINKTENPIVRDLLRRLKAGWTELVGSQSSDRTTGLNPADKVRLTALIANIVGVLEASIQTLDMPENPTDAGPSATKK